MHTQQLSPHQVEPSHAVERSEERAIESEIAVRLLELREATSRDRVVAFISKLHAIASLTEREAIWVVLELMTGDLGAITKPYEETGRERSLDKQAIQQQMERVIIGIRRHYPELAGVIVQLRHITANVKQDTQRDAQ